MNTLVVGDIHANYPALKAVFNDMPSTVDTVICTGDIVGLMGYPQETVELLFNNVDISVKGNHDVAVINKNEGHVNNEELSEFEYKNTWENLDDEYIDWIKGLQPYQEEDNILVAHAKPYPEEASGYEKGNGGVIKRHYPRVASNIDDELFDFVLLGHTHEQAGLDCSQFHHDIIVVNPGTVGQNEGVAEYALLDTEKGSYSLEQVPYDFTKVTNKLVEEEIPVKFWEKNTSNRRFRRR